TIIDANTGTVISYVNIGIPEKAIGTVSDLNGVYEFEVQDENDEIVISCIGYKTIQITAKEFLVLEEVQLIPVEYAIDEVTVVASRFKNEVILGVENPTKRGMSLGFGSNQLGTEVACPIAVKQTTYIKSFNFVLNHAKGDSMIFRLNIYELNKDGIGEQILKEQIVIREKQKKGLHTIDLSAIDLVLDQNVLVSLEWLEDDGGKGNQGLSFNMRKSKKPNGFYLKIASQAEMKHLKEVGKWTPAFYFEGFY
ncbi:MAG: carboxypeptidase-like regulatory domain-containing protein, partial [Bacteroidota bacterium]